MGKPAGFLEYERIHASSRSVSERTNDYHEININPPQYLLEQEGARCMDCGVPFCHSIGCPVYNLIPEWNDAVFKGQWREAWDRLELTNNLPEITGRVCPAPCETACTLAINDSPVSIKKIEVAIAETAFKEGWAVPRTPKHESGKKIAIVGSGPSGLAAAQQLRRMGHKISLFEKSDRIGGLLRYGIPDFKLEKHVLDRRLDQMAREGVEFETNVVIGEDLSARYLRRKYDVVLLTMGSGTPRDLDITGRNLNGVHFAMDYLSLSNKSIAGDFRRTEIISAKNKKVLVIGGGDTGSDCVGTAIRQGAEKVTQVEIMPKPLEWKHPHNPDWPLWPNILRTSSSHEEGCDRDWSIATKKFSGKKGNVEAAHCSRVEWIRKDAASRPEMIDVTGSDFTIEVDLVLLALGFVHVDHGRLTDELTVKFDERGNISVDENYQSSEPGVFAAGDASSGASLVVRAINHGRRAAAAIGGYLL